MEILEGKIDYDRHVFGDTRTRGFQKSKDGK
jgi:hypothetical protein